MRGLSWMYLILSLLISSAATAAPRIHIFDIRKNLPLKTGEVIYRDFYINGGYSEGFKEGMIFTVVRRIPMHDTYQNKSQGDLILPVARLKIIHVSDTLSVARFHSNVDRKSLPMIEYDAVMIGDRIDLASAFVEKKITTTKKSRGPAKSGRKTRAPFLGPVKPIELMAEPIAPDSQDRRAETTVPPRG